MKPLTKDEASALLAAIDAAKAKRAADMPTEQDAVRAMFDAWQRLKELGWSEAIYCPKDGTMFKAIEPGSTGFHDCIYRGEWPSGSWWVVERGDAWPSRPCLWKPLTASKPKRRKRVADHDPRGYELSVEGSLD